MKCFNHENREAVATCQRCGKGLCRECAGKYTPCLCDDCFEAIQNENHAQKVAAAENRRQSRLDRLSFTVGDLIANCVLGAVLWQKEVMPVDTHVFRVSERIGLTTRSKTPLQTELTLEKNIPGHLLPLAHHWLILHGRYVCVARAPKCDECGIATWCRKYASEHRQPKTLKI